MKKHGAWIAIILLCGLSIGQTKSSLHSREFNPEAMKLIEKGQKSLEKGKFGKAKKNFKEALKIFDKAFQAYGYLGVIADQENDTAESLKQFAKSVAVFDDYKAHLLERKTDYFKEMEREMISEQSNINRRTTNHADSNSGNPALMQDQARAKKDRVAQLKKQLEETKNLSYPAFFHFKYGNTLMKAKQAGKALEQYEKAVASDPEFKDTYANLAVVYFMAQDCEKAMKTFKKGKELGTNFHPAFEKDLLAKCQ